MARSSRRILLEVAPLEEKLLLSTATARPPVPNLTIEAPPPRPTFFVDGTLRGRFEVGGSVITVTKASGTLRSTGGVKATGNLTIDANCRVESGFLLLANRKGSLSVTFAQDTHRPFAADGRLRLHFLAVHGTGAYDSVRIHGVILARFSQQRGTFVATIRTANP